MSSFIIKEYQKLIQVICKFCNFQTTVFYNLLYFAIAKKYNLAMEMIKRKQIFSTYQVIAITFFALISIGTLLLMLPVSTTSGHGLSFVDAFFMSTSAVCVTGLTVVDTGIELSLFGQLVLIFLIQCGGLGLMTFATVFFIVFGKKINYPERILMRDALNQGNVAGIVKLTLNLFKLSLLIEFIAGTILAYRFFQDYGIKGIYFGYWHAISAFCNAGFDLFGHFQSIVPYNEDWVVNIILTTLIIFGGLGFTVLLDVFSRKRFNEYFFHSKIVILSSLFFIISGTFLIFFLEQNNAATLGKLSFEGKFLASYFQSVSPRTAGFNSIDLTALNPETIFFIILLMFIGASPASTGGGIKTTTFVLVIISTWVLIRGKADTVIFGRRINNATIHKAFVITAISSIIVAFGVFVITILETQPFLYILFETVSAFATVGLSAGITGELCDASKIILSLIMFAGRVGPLTLALALAMREPRGSIRYPEENIIIG